MHIQGFLLARIAEDEELARAAIAPDQMYPYGDTTIPPTPVKGWGNEVRGYLGGTWGEHCAQHAPTRVLRECAAKRAIVELHGYEWMGPDDAAGKGCEHDYEEWPCPTIRSLAAVYSDHPDYQQEWAV